MSDIGENLDTTLERTNVVAGQAGRMPSSEQWRAQVQESVVAMLDGSAKADLRKPKDNELDLLTEMAMMLAVDTSSDDGENAALIGFAAAALLGSRKPGADTPATEWTPHSVASDWWDWAFGGDDCDRLKGQIKEKMAHIRTILDMIKRHCSDGGSGGSTPAEFLHSSMGSTSDTAPPSPRCARMWRVLDDAMGQFDELLGRYQKC